MTKKFELMPIFKIRIFALKNIDLDLYKKMRFNLVREGLAAQEFMKNGFSYTSDNRKRQIDYPTIIRLVSAFKEDLSDGIIDKKGNFVKKDSLKNCESKVMTIPFSTYYPTEQKLRNFEQIQKQLQNDI